MTKLRTLAALAGLVMLGASGVAYADTDCDDPITEWKSREILRQQVEQRGWTVQRIKVDDGCYEVRGIDRRGNKIKAKYAPASLRIRSLEVDFGLTGDASDYVGTVQSKSNRGEPTLPANKGTLP